MSKFTFTLPKAATKKANKEGVTLVAGKYNFKDGELTVDEATARKIKPILTRFYGCKVSKAADAESADRDESDDDSSLSKSSTKAQTESKSTATVDSGTDKQIASGDSKSSKTSK